ncbi:hypothetical protein ABT297_34555 [Dactylosporangium sp. NPDC000555]|uniref:hypothetical protein n=1 Tax=Dactylosporangium sp. NPDC000555 TaxID=3154260 RepID=UPI00332248CB
MHGTRWGLSSERLREAGAALFPPGPDHQDDTRIPFAAELREALERGIRKARASGHDQVTTVDLLVALLGPEAGPEAVPAAELLRAAESDPAAMRAALAERDHDGCCQEAGVSAARPILAEMGSRAALMPGRLRSIAGVVGTLIPYALLYAAVLAVTWDTSGPELVLTVGAVTTLVPLTLSPLEFGGRSGNSPRRRRRPSSCPRTSGRCWTASAYVSSSCASSPESPRTAVTGWAGEHGSASHDGPIADHEPRGSRGPAR